MSMNADEARAARREGRRVEWWDTLLGGWRRGEVRKIERTGLGASVLETGKTRSRRIPLDRLRLAGDKVR